MKKLTDIRPYHTLLSILPGEDLWGIEFGDYERRTVKEEADSLRETYPDIKLRIIKTNGDQSAINSVVADMNFELRGEQDDV